MNEDVVVIVNGVCMSMGGFQGVFVFVIVIELGVVVICEVVVCVGIVLQDVEEVIMGCVLLVGLK